MVAVTLLGQSNREYPQMIGILKNQIEVVKEI
jgi:hypothetical protein